MKKPFIFLILFFAVVFASQAQGDGLLVKQGDKGLYLDHTVSSGQGLYSVGRLYNVSPKYIASFNKSDINKGLEIGQVIRIPLTDTNFTQKSNKGIPVYYTVGASEGLLKVSNVNNKVTMQKLRDWNGLKSDALQVGQRLIVGYLVSKEMQNVVSSAPKVTPAKPEEKPVVKNEPVQEQPKTAPVIGSSTQPVQTTPVKEEPKKEEPKKEEHKKAEPAPRQDNPVSSGQGYFKTFYEHQVKQSPVAKNTTVTAGIFKTSSGWEDAKYYLLIDGVATGTIVQLINPDNNKAIYAKVLGEMNGIRQNQGLGIRISNAGAAALGVTDSEKFIVKIIY
ncbi:LysM peptidoglycan-binding domain-containing protein [Terrimonas sp. NA20]|uniref:LysM peptidoglycan-binding domain-containing protein n=1 Tax=Terrimonas ginsenosidimutans TaxID=2908004 RepID=A0ABS9KY36_9BACT|nr:LysM peptidoglycan-binding domain-containing protein [Terrimonas ginsenosidimutans]MCG2617256.1 LysM peptidoglycan-binding domain-containing protein [Terrimonas ginsenosidimutans]